MTTEEAFRALQVDPAACRQVVDAAFGVLREMCLRDDADDAPRRLAELTLAHRIATDVGTQPASVESGMDPRAPRGAAAARPPRRRSGGGV